MSRLLLQVPLLAAIALSFVVLFQTSVGRTVEFNIGQTFRSNVKTLVTPGQIPEPTTLLLFGLGLVSVAAYIRR